MNLRKTEIELTLKYKLFSLCDLCVKYKILDILGRFYNKIIIIIETISIIITTILILTISRICI